MDLGSAAQRTLGASVGCSGVGLHTGAPVAMTLHPAEINTGVTFVRTDAPAGQRVIPAAWDRVRDTTLCTAIANESGVGVSTVEHLMAALRGCGVDNVLVEIDGPEVPILDGSAAPFVSLVEAVGTVPQAAARRAIRVLRTLDVVDGAGRVRLAPGAGSLFTFEIDFASAAVRRQRVQLRLGEPAFRAELAPARTFGFLEDVERLRARGLAQGASLDNAVVVSGDRVLNPEGLRFPDEFVRHKMLDAVGDLYLAGAPILGHFSGHRSGHQLNNRLLRLLLADERAWCYDAAEPAERMPAWQAEERVAQLA